MAKSPSLPKSFEAAVAELENIVRDMESGQLALEDALTHYQRGVNLLRHCQNTLGAAEEQLRILEGDALALFTPETSTS